MTNNSELIVVAAACGKAMSASGGIIVALTLERPDEALNELDLLLDAADEIRAVLETLAASSSWKLSQTEERTC